MTDDGEDDAELQRYIALCRKRTARRELACPECLTLHPVLEGGRLVCRACCRVCSRLCELVPVTE